jgi:hypothetical protein
VYTTSSQETLRRGVTSATRATYLYKTHLLLKDGIAHDDLGDGMGIRHKTHPPGTINGHAQRAGAPRGRR